MNFPDHIPADGDARSELSVEIRQLISDIADDTLLNGIAKASRRTGLSRSTLYRMMERGELNFVLIGSRRLIPEEALRSLGTTSEAV
jgi:excisionase family DNA binding protein